MIHPTHSSLGLNPGVINQPAPQQAARPRAVAGDTLSTAQSSALQEALRSQPEIRPDAVARGKALAADPELSLCCDHPSDQRRDRRVARSQRDASPVKTIPAEI